VVTRPSVVPHGTPPVFFTAPGLASTGLAHAMTTRNFPGLSAWASGGVPFGPAAVAAMAPAGIDLGRAAWARQVHGADVARVAAGGPAGPADALVTTSAGVPLAIFTADCVPLVLHDASAGVLAVAHAGWRGTVRGVVQAAVAAACAAGARAERIRAAIAPAIGPCCYEVDAPVIAEFAAAWPGQYEPWVRPGRPGHWMLDLGQASEDLLARAGVPPASIENVRLCTACDPGLFYSYRKGHRGRLLTVAALD
jgi:YfiH family protein